MVKRTSGVKVAASRAKFSHPEGTYFAGLDSLECASKSNLVANFDPLLFVFIEASDCVDDTFHHRGDDHITGRAGMHAIHGHVWHETLSVRGQKRGGVVCDRNSF